MQYGTLHVIGIDLQNFSTLPIAVLRKCSAIVASKRFTTLTQKVVDDPERYEFLSITPLKEATEKIRDRLKSGDVAVLASGDPLFFGIGRWLLDMFGHDIVKIYPAPSSIQYTFARFGIPWDDAAFVSLHGRNPENYVGTLLAHDKTAILTDGNNRPETIARELLAFLSSNQSHYCVYVAENIGMNNERLITGTIEEIAKTQFGSLCCMLLVRVAPMSISYPVLGLIEEDIVHSRGLITKSEVRAAALHALALPANSILWDIGAGSGSVGLEAARMHKDMLVYSVEKEVEQHYNILSNVTKFQVANLKLVKGEAPDQLCGLPRPDRVFIGGSGGNLAEIVDVCAMQLKPDGRIVITGVLEKTCNEAPELLFRSGLQVEMRRIEVQRITYPEKEKTTFNPITIIIGKKR